MSNIQGRRRPGDPRFVRNKELAAYLGTTVMSVWRWRHKPELNFPKPAVINKIEYTDLDEIDAWMRSRVVDRTNKEVARAKKEVA